MCGDSPGDFRTRFGKCYDADTCVVDPSCEFYTDHCEDAEAFAANFAPAPDSGRETEATAQPDFTAG
jgi:hypothetical protein